VQTGKSVQTVTAGKISRTAHKPMYRPQPSDLHSFSLRVDADCFCGRTIACNPPESSDLQCFSVWVYADCFCRRAIACNPPESSDLQCFSVWVYADCFCRRTIASAGPELPPWPVTFYGHIPFS